MVTFCDILNEAKQKQTLETAQYGLEISFKIKVITVQCIIKKYTLGNAQNSPHRN